jgi:hypothetical protein
VEFRAFGLPFDRLVSRFEEAFELARRLLAGEQADGFARLAARIPPGVERSACVLVEVDGGAGERRREPGAPPVELPRLPAHLRELAAAGADEAILVVDPITEGSPTCWPEPQLSGTRGSGPSRRRGPRASGRGSARAAT